MKYRHIVWDWNGTLLNDAEACTRAVSLILEKRNKGKVSVEEYREKLVFPAINMYYDSGITFENESYEDICNEYITNYINSSDLIDLHKDAGTVLENFRKRGLSQHIVSASGRDILYEQVEKYNLTQYFTHILGQENNMAESKVHLAEKLKHLIGCDPKEVLFIGDTLHDFEVAKEVGFDCRLVSNGHCSKSRLLTSGVPVYTNLTELYNDL
ncbi:MAG: HAD family hydrolase [Clostridiaceae bacterium]|nr:HAD family hydrolase [Clostridiaceae bacterium]